MDDPNDIIACSISKLLFVADCRMDKPNSVGCLWKVCPSGKVTRWLLGGGLSPYSLSIRNGRILVTPLDAKQLLIFNTEQQLKKKIALPKRMEPRHAVETENKTIIIAHWGRHKGSRAFQIAEFDASGNSLKSFCSQEDLNDFPYVWLDMTGRVLVVDSWNSRIILLNKELQMERTLVGHLDNNPYRLCYMEQAGLLFVGESGEYVKVFNVSFPPSTIDAAANHTSAQH